MKRHSQSNLSIRDLHNLIIQSLSDSIIWYSSPSIKPMVVEVKIPSIRKFRIYAHNCGNPPGGRPIDEYKIVLNVGQQYGQKGNFDYSEGCIALVIGYVFNHDVFVLWDANKHKDFAFNKNLQVRSETILRALAYPISFQERRTKNGIETIIAARQTYLRAAMNKRIDILYEDIVGECK